MSTIPSAWISYPEEDDTDRNELGLEAPIWTHDSVPNLCQDSVIDNLDDHSIVDLMNNATSEGWNSDHFEIDSSFGQTGLARHTPSKIQKQSGSDYRSNGSNQTRRPPQRNSQNPETTKSCIQELVKLNEMLLREKSSLDDPSTPKSFESGGLSIGQILHNCQDFLSILQRLRSSCSNSESNGSLTATEWSNWDESEIVNGSVNLHPLSRHSISSNAVQSRSQKDASSSSSSSRSLSASLAPGGPSLEIPTLLSILSCYTYILESYDNLFTPILDAVTGLTPTIPAILSGLRLDGFELDGHNALQLQCLVNVSFHLLEKIENILVGSPGHGGLFSQARGGLLGDKLFDGLIDALYDQNEQNSHSNSNGKREVRAKRLIRQIQAALKAIDL
ncbi:hypothetical protein F5B20DRAFT_587455 [Whalleya microplaca]|nr:hypothetical protein F5B20DRAFT_587455 [Whalleya microplaca]